MSRFFPGPKVKMGISRNYFPSKLAEAVFKHDKPFEKIIPVTLTGDKVIRAKYGVSYILFKTEQYYDGRIAISVKVKSQSTDSISKTKIWDLKSPKSSQRNIEKEIGKQITEVCQDFVQRINGIGKYGI